MHPDFNIEYYINLLSSIKSHFNINIHGFSPPEICYIADKSDLTIRETVKILKSAGLDSIPGGGAEILSDRSEILSPRKIKSSSWLKVMEEAHRLGMRTTATMMFGALKSRKTLLNILDAIRNLQDRTEDLPHLSVDIPAGKYGVSKKRSVFSVQRSATKTPNA